MIFRSFARLGLALAVAALASAAPAQIGSVDPNAPPPPATTSAPPPVEPVEEPTADSGPAWEGAAPADPAPAEAAPAATVKREDVFSAAEGVFGKGAEGLAGIIEDLLSKQGEPNATITGREAGGAIAIGVRYGSGMLHHAVEGDRRVWWRGPSIGFDLGANADKVFALVYNLHDSEKLFRRYPAAEGNVHVVGGFTASYLRRGDVVIIPIRLGVGARLGVSAGYMRFSRKNRWVPF